MRDEIKSELKVWAQYLVIAFVAEVMAFVAFFPDCDGCAYQVSALISNVFEEYERPRLRAWFAIFMVLSAVRFTSRVIILRHRRHLTRG
jgi:hypothetical protein